MLRRPVNAKFLPDIREEVCVSRHSSQPLISSEARALSAFDSAGTERDSLRTKETS